MVNSRRREAIADWATIGVSVVALTMVGGVVLDRLNGQGGADEDRFISDWQDYVDSPKRFGQGSAAVTIMEFNDYECPFCRRFEPHAAAVRDRYPSEVAFVVMHLPLPQHTRALEAAVWVECAARQGRFAPAHRALFKDEDLRSMTLERLMAEAGVDDDRGFRDCVASEEATAAVRAEIGLARDWKITKTPSVVINGLLLASTPDSVKLFEIVDRMLREAR